MFSASTMRQRWKKRWEWQRKLKTALAFSLCMAAGPGPACQTLYLSHCTSHFTTWHDISQITAVTFLPFSTTWLLPCLNPSFLIPLPLSLILSSLCVRVSALRCCHGYQFLKCLCRFYSWFISTATNTRRKWTCDTSMTSLFERAL